MTNLNRLATAERDLETLQKQYHMLAGEVETSRALIDKIAKSTDRDISKLEGDVTTLGEILDQCVKRLDRLEGKDNIE